VNDRRYPGWEQLLKVYIITDPSLCAPLDTPTAVTMALQGGATTIQLRAKGWSDRRLWSAAGAIRRLTREWGALFIVNDRADIALAARADGVHVGPHDLPAQVVRSLGRENLLVGVSVDTAEEAEAAVAEGADYLGVGSIFTTTTKGDAGPAVGVDAVSLITRRTGAPVVGIGGITPLNARRVIEAGARGVAVISSVMGSANITRATRALAEAVDGAAGEAEFGCGPGDSLDPAGRKGK